MFFGSLILSNFTIVEGLGWISLELTMVNNQGSLHRHINSTCKVESLTLGDSYASLLSFISS